MVGFGEKRGYSTVDFSKPTIINKFFNMNVKEIFKWTDNIHYWKMKLWRRIIPSSLDWLVKQISIGEVVQSLWFKITKKNIICFMHNEKTPSCNVVEEKNMLFCKWCGFVWNSMDLVMKIRWKNQIQAAKWLQKKFVPDYQLKFENMIDTVELSPWDMNDYLDYADLESWIDQESVKISQDVEDYQEYTKLLQSCILQDDSYEIKDTGEINSIEKFYNDHSFAYDDRVTVDE